MFPVAILAGGLATRLRPQTETTPKALLDVNGEPFVAHQLRLLRARGIVQVVLCIGYLGEQIARVVGDGSQFGLKVTYSFDGPTLRGTAGAIKNALPLLDESFLVLYGDSYLECDYTAVQTAFERAGKQALMTVYRNEGHWDTSNVEFADGHMRAYSKQQRTERMKHIDYGLGVFSRAAFIGVPERTPYDLEMLYRDMLEQGQLAVCEVSQRFYEIGSPAGLEELRQHLAETARASSRS